MKQSSLFSRTLRVGTARGALALLGAGAAFASVPALAQDAPAAAAPAPQDDQAADAGDIVVTGTLFKGGAVTPSPVTSVTAENLDARGITSISDGILKLASTAGPSLPNSFTANGAFAGGASAVSLRGLSTNSTLVLFDGQRAAYYPLADDGSRNFVDLNTIPDDIVEKIDVLRDGASASYGADAIAGVVNIITKKEFKGVAARAEAGIAQRGYNANQRLSLTAGTGDLGEDGYNFYASGFYQRSEAVLTKDLPAPFNSSDTRGLCFQGVCGPNNAINGLDGTGSFPNTGFAVNPPADALYVLRANATNTATSGRYQLLNPARGCGLGTAYNPTPAELAGSQNALVPTTVCIQDPVHDYGSVSPNIERFGLSTRGTFKLGDTTEASLELNFQQATTNFSGSPGTVNANANTGINFQRFSTLTNSAVNAPGSFALTLPVYVCATGRGDASGLNTGCNATNGTLNPNNPFAADGGLARIVGRLSDVRRFNETRSRVYRAAFNLNGSLGSGWDYSVNATAMHTDLRQRFDGYIRIQNLLDAIARGTYNFVDPTQNSQAARNAVAPELRSFDTSDLDQLTASVQKSLFALPGGDARLAVGGEVRYEAIDSPSSNDDAAGPTERYFVLNAFGTKGHRTVSSAYGELDLPVFDSLDVKASGRYDHYSSGQNAFSPKVGVKFTPLKELTLRGTFSRGFRIPSFGEANALPTTGFVTRAANTLPANILAQYGCAGNPTACPSYLNYNLGETTLATPDLKPEKSRSFTAGIKLDPIRNVSLTVDFFDIEKTDVITAPAFSQVINAYYAGQPIPAGFTATPDAPLAGFPNATPRLAFVAAHLINANKQHSQGIDFAANASFQVTPGVRFRSDISASLLLDLSTTFPGGRRERYVGTLGNFNLTAGSGTQRWHGYWTNSIELDQASFNLTANYTSGYDLSAEDQSNPARCGQSGGFTPCNVKSYLTFDLNSNFKVNEKFNFYVNVINLFNRLPPVDPVTYGANLYNPVVAGNGIFGRQFTAGAKVKF